MMLRLTSTGIRRVSVARSVHATQSQLWLSTRKCRAPQPGSQNRRFLATTHEPPSTQKLTVQGFPSLEYLEEEEINAKMFSENDIKISLTDRAAEKLHHVSESQKDPTVALRLAVDSGGCHGFQYRLELANQSAPDDYRLSHPSISHASVVIDATSLPMVNGTTIDFATELIGSQFQILENPNAVGGGCGCGISWELKPGVLD